MIIKTRSVLIVLITHLLFHAIAVDSSRTATYEQAWVEGKFSGEKMRSIVHLEPSEEYLLTERQKDYLVSSTGLTNLKTLNLRNQELTDNFIKKLCENFTFSRIINLDLSNNPALTAASLQYISDSEYIGSIRDEPKLSTRYKIPSSEVQVNVSGTSVDRKTIEKFNQQPQNFNFIIRYIDPYTEERVARTSYNAIKWLQVKQFHYHTHCQRIGNFCHHNRDGHACLKRNPQSAKEIIHFIKRHLGHDIKHLDLGQQKTLNHSIFRKLAKNPEASGITYLSLERSSTVEHGDILELLNSQTFGSLRNDEVSYYKDGTPISTIAIEIGQTTLLKDYQEGRFDYPLPLHKNFIITYYRNDFEILKTEIGYKRILFLDHGKELAA